MPFVFNATCGECPVLSSVCALSTCLLSDAACCYYCCCFQAPGLSRHFGAVCAWQTNHIATAGACFESLRITSVCPLLCVGTTVSLHEYLVIKAYHSYGCKMFWSSSQGPMDHIREDVDAGISIEIAQARVVRGLLVQNCTIMRRLQRFRRLCFLLATRLHCVSPPADCTHGRQMLCYHCVPFASAHPP